MDRTPRSRLFAFLLAIVALGLGACAQTGSQREVFLADIETKVKDGYTYDEITLKIMLGALSGQVDPRASDLEKFEFDPRDPEEERYDPAAAERDIIQFATNLHDRNCAPIMAEIETSNKDENQPLLRIEAYLYDQGICVEQDKAAAAILYKDVIKRNEWNAIAHARLGALIWHGNGVEQNKALARDYFRRAAILQAPWVWILDAMSPDFRSKDSSTFELWGMTNFDLTARFGEFATGPWPVPELLRLEIEGYLSLKQEDPGQILEIARKMLEGRDGFEKDPDSAISWIRHASELEVDGAWYLEILWHLDPVICRQRHPLLVFGDCQDEFSSWFGTMEKAAFDGRHEALRFMVKYYTNAPDDEWADWSLYQFCLVGERAGAPCKGEISEAVKVRLSEIEQQVVEAWVREDIRLPIADYLPREQD